MTIIPPTTSPSPSGGAPARSPASGRALTADFQTFLTMLTTQMRNQDPLNPMQSSDFAVQLATFSGVEQQVRTNELLTSFLGQSGLAQSAGMIGMDVQIDGPVVFGGNPVRLALPPGPEVGTRELVMTGPLGNVVSRQPLAPGQREASWSGLGPDGTPLPPGAYRADVVWTSGGREIAALPAAQQGRVAEVRLDGSTPVLVLEDGRAVAADDVAALRRT